MLGTREPKTHKARVNPRCMSAPEIDALGMDLLGLVISATVLFHRLMRIQFIRLSHYIVYYEWPMVWYVDRLLQHVLVARSTGDYDHEEDMYCRLVFLYRSPETLIRVTKFLRPELMAKFNEPNSKYKPLW